MKIQALFVLAATATSLFAQEIPCRTVLNAVKDYPRDAAANSMFAIAEARVLNLETTPQPERAGKPYEAGLKICDLSVELLKVHLNKVALQRSTDSLNKKNIASQKEISLVKDSLVELWSKEALGAKSLNALLSEERARLEQLNKEKAEELEKNQKALAQKDSLIAAQKAEADKRLEALNSKAMSVYKDARGTILSMSDILFESGKADLKQELKDNLTEVAAILKTLLADSDVEIEGHTDNVGNATSNEKLSKQRADGVLSHLVSRGIDKKRLKAVGYGLTKPVADNNTEEGRAKNRRVELVIKETKK
jgi:outer membrane protein OmpA-like peptidoglycan-associated protein